MERFYVGAMEFMGSWVMMRTDDKNYPVYVVDGEGSSVHLSGIIQVISGRDHTCALKSNGELLCWGLGTYGRLGNDGTARTDHPVNVVDGDSSSTALNLGEIFQLSYTCRGSDGSCARNNITFAVSGTTPTDVEVSGPGSGVSIFLYSDSLCANQIASSTSSTVDLSSVSQGSYNIYYKTSDNFVCSKNSFAFSRTALRSNR